MHSLEQIIIQGPNLDASDVIIETGDAARFKVHGETNVHETLEKIHSEADIIGFLRKYLPGFDPDQVLRKKEEIDASMTLESGTFVRANIYRTSRGIAATLRYLPDSIPALD